MSMKEQDTRNHQLVEPFRETILIADDDPHIREVVTFSLTKSGFRTCEASNGKECLTLYNTVKPDLIILDILMPEMDGTEVCKEIRGYSTVPVIFLTSRDDEIDRVLGLELGGDDYVTKPFSPRELVARVKAILRRSHSREKAGEDPGKVTMGKLSLDQERFQVFWKTTEVSLTATEFGLLQALMNQPGRVYSRDELMDRAYDHATMVTDRTIDSHIRKLRAKFAQVGGEPIETVRGVGYKLGPCL